MDANTYYDKTLGGWLGKNIGGTLGGPWEGHTSSLLLYFYDPVPSEAMPNDDFELQLVWLDMLRKKGIYLKPADFVHHWREHTRYYISEYFVGQRNMALGLMPPVTGDFNNWYIRGMGATIRSEIWGMIAPGLPDIAAAYAYLDASTDHSRDGMYGEMFFAAMESYAYVEDDLYKIIAKGLEFVPEDSEINEAVGIVLEELERGVDITRIRHLLCAHFAHPTDFTYAPLNVGFAVLGLLSSADYGEILCNTVNCGYDTDCTGATAASLLGIIRGAKETPERWLKPIGYPVVVSDLLVDVDYADDIREVTKQVCALGEEVVKQADAVREHLYRWTGLPFLRPDGASPEYRRTEVVLGWNEALGMRLCYAGPPTIGVGETKVHQLRVFNTSDTVRTLRLEIMAPEGVTLHNLEEQSQTLSTHVVLPAGGCMELPIRIAVPEDSNIAGPSFTVSLRLTADKTTPLEVGYAVVLKAAWRCTEAIDSADRATQTAIEESGALENAPVAVTQRLHGVDDLTDFIPEPGKVAYAQVTMQAEAEPPVRVVANNTGPIRVFHNGRRIINKEHWLPGIAPSWHLQVGDGSTHLLPKNAGYADITLQPGANVFLFRLEGHERPQDATFHLAQIFADDPAKAKMGDYRPATAIVTSPR